VSADRRQFTGDSDARIPRAPGAIVGDRYRIVRVIARGGTGVVYEAEHTWTERRVAVKMLLPSHASGEAETRRFREEAKSAARLVHPHIVDIIDMGSDGEDGALFIVQGLLVGEDLEQRLERVPRLEADELVRIVRPILDALRVAHARGVLHRDLKPSNIFLVAGDAGRYPPGAAGEVIPKLIDFGASKRLDEAGDLLRLTQNGALVGTPIYMSPEQLRGEPLDARSDIWSLGVVMYRALTGHHPFDAASFTVLVNQILTVRAAAISDPAVPRVVAAVVHRALATRRDDRFASVAAMIDALDASVAAPGARRATLEPPPSDDPTLLEAGLHREIQELALAQGDLPPISDELTNVPAENERVDESVNDGGFARRDGELLPQTPVDEPTGVLHAALAGSVASDGKRSARPHVVRVVAEPTPTPAPHAIRRRPTLVVPGRRPLRKPWRGNVRLGLVATPRIAGGDALRKLVAMIDGSWSVKRFASYSTLVDALCEDEIELAWLPPVAYLRARKLGPVHLLLALERAGQSAYASALIAPQRAGIRSLADVRGKRVAWVDVWSAAGYLMPRSLLREAGHDPAQVFASQAFVGSYAAVLDALDAGRADLGATFCSIDDDGALVAAPWVDRPGLAPIALSGAIPGDAICAGGELSLEDAEAMVSPLIALAGEPEGAELLRRLFGTDRFAEVDPSYYQVLEGV